MNTQVVVRVDEFGADAERLTELAEALRTELLELDLDDVRALRGGDPPPGSRGIDVAVVGALLASLNGSAEVGGKLLTTVRSWLDRGNNSVQRTVELSVGDKKLKLTGASNEQQDRLIEEFVSALGRA